MVANLLITEAYFQCYFCKKPVGEDMFCYGCDEFICSDCDVGKPTYDHEPEEHLDSDWGKE